MKKYGQNNNKLIKLKIKQKSIYNYIIYFIFVLIISYDQFLTTIQIIFIKTHILMAKMHRTKQLRRLKLKSMMKCVHIH